MSLERKIRLIIIATLFGLIAVLYIAFKFILLNRFDDLENQYLWKEVKQSEKQYLDFLDKIDTHLKEYSDWGETVRYVQSSDVSFQAAYEAINLEGYSFRNLGIELAAFLDRDCKIVSMKTWDLENDAAETTFTHRLTENMETRLTESCPLLAPPHDGSVKGMMMLDSGPMLLVSRPILKDSGSGEAFGVAIFGRRLTKSLLVKWSRDVTGKMEFIPIHHLLENDVEDESAFYSQAREALKQLREQKGFTSNSVFIPINEKRINAYFLVREISDKPKNDPSESPGMVTIDTQTSLQKSILFRIELPRDIHRQKNLTELMLIISLLTAGLVFGLAVHFLLQYQLVTRLAKFDADLYDLSVSQDVSQRIHIRGNDELAHVGKSVNRMLESLESYKAELAASKETAMALMNASIDTALLVDLDGRILENNRPPRDLLSGDVKELKDQNFADVFQPEWADFLKGCVQIVSEKEEAMRFEKTDEQNVLDISMYPVFNAAGNCGSVAIFIRDITRRKKAEESLMERERQYREIVEYANSIILRWDSDGTIRYINDFGLRFFGYKPEELIGKSLIGTLVPEQEDSGESLHTVIKNISEHPERYIWHENKNMRWNGEIVYVAWGNKPLLDDDGNIVEILSMGIDVTDSKQKKHDSGENDDTP
ncbi:MAG: PAS domain S-box protein [Candidatus Sumerlaeia bacterium]